MTNATRIRLDIVTPRALTGRERDQLLAELTEWAKGRVMRMGATIPTQAAAELTPSRELLAERERLDAIEIALDIG